LAFGKKFTEEEKLAVSHV